VRGGIVSQGNSEHTANPDSGAYGVLIRAFPTCKFLVLRFRIFMETAVIVQCWARNVQTIFILDA
jgi:hypothetical protein